MLLAEPPPAPPNPNDARDELTGLLRRTAFLDALAAALAAFERGEAEPPTLLLLDLDRFKSVNDTLGHAAGDALLAGAASRIRARLRQGDAAGRLGGDEFAALLLPPVDAATAETVATRLVDVMGRPFIVEGQVAQVGLSVGIASAGPGLSAPELLKRADLALYAAKRRGRNRHAVFDPSLQAAATERHALALDLRAALALGQFALVYQPLLDLKTGLVQGAEALLRWHRPGFGLVAAPGFLPFAEELGLMPSIGAWVLRTACAEAATWPGEATVAVNVSPTQFSDGNLPALVSAALRESGLAPARLELEVTENALMVQGSDGPLAQFEAIRALGVRLAMDDFGSGFSSLSQLRGFPFDRVKLDRAFAGDLPMMRAALGVGHALGLATTAEGIESADQLAAARREGCDTGQGYLIGRPIGAAELRDRLGESVEDRQGDPR